MKNKIFMGFLAIALVAVLTSCGKAPQVEMDAAQAAIATAKAAQADLYVPAEYKAIQDSVNAVLESIEARKGKLFVRFTEEKEKLVAITAKAAVVKANGEAAKAKLIAEIETMFSEMTELVAENNTLVAKAPKGKGGAAVIAEIKSEMAVIDASVVEANTLFTSGSYFAAKAKLKSAKESAMAINTELKEAIAKKGGK
ncbi:MAG: hypothetical protein CVU00_14310 [Bacteroidetes bacterium HGW-Bacteroidetes-17]|jgi:hypothetical protein|nr:MAG: hypothetical protein CVU00_14310 [Bacteroidetes bacterium HGW-Bacteroidetes-17]